MTRFFSLVLLILLFSCSHKNNQIPEKSETREKGHSQIVKLNNDNDLKENKDVKNEQPKQNKISSPVAIAGNDRQPDLIDNEIGIEDSIRKDLDAMIVQEYNFKITEDKYAEIFTEDFYNADSQEDLFIKVLYCLEEYQKWLNEESNHYREFSEQRSLFKTAEEKYVFNTVLLIISKNFDIIENFFSYTATKLVRQNQQYSSLNFIQESNTDKYIIKKVEIDSVAWVPGVLGAIYWISISLDKTSENNERININVALIAKNQDSNKEPLFKESLLLSPFNRTENGSYKLHLNESISQLKIIHNVDHFLFLLSED